MGNLRKTSTSDIDRYIGHQLSVQRRKRNLEKRRIAKCLDLTVSEYEQAECGTRSLSASDLFRLKKVFGVPLPYFFSHDGEFFSDVILDETEMADVFHYFSNIENEKVREHLLKQIRIASGVF